MPDLRSFRRSISAARSLDFDFVDSPIWLFVPPSPRMGRHETFRTLRKIAAFFAGDLAIARGHRGAFYWKRWKRYSTFPPCIICRASSKALT